MKTCLIRIIKSPLFLALLVMAGLICGTYKFFNTNDNIVVLAAVISSSVIMFGYFATHYLTVSRELREKKLNQCLELVKKIRFFILEEHTKNTGNNGVQGKMRDELQDAYFAFSLLTSSESYKALSEMMNAFKSLLADGTKINEFKKAQSIFINKLRNDFFIDEEIDFETYDFRIEEKKNRITMQYSVVNYKTVKENSDFRIDGEYYHPTILSRLNLLEGKNNKPLDEVAKFVVGPFGSTVTVDKYVNKSDYRYIRNKDVNDFIISDYDPALIPENVYSPLKQFHIKKDDLLLTVVGTLGKVAIAQEKDSKSIFSCKSTLLRSKNLNPYYLLTYLNTPTGQIFSLRGKRGAIQEGLNLSDLKSIKVFIPSNDFQNFVEKLILKFIVLLGQSKTYYIQAEQFFLSELGLTDWKPKHEIAFVKKFSDTQKSDRFDAEYFQPKYEEIIEAVKKYKGGFDELGNLVKIKKSVEPGSEAYQESGVPFVRVSNISKFELSTNNQQFISEKLYEELKLHQPKKGEILLSKDATPGIAYFLNEEPQKMIVSGGILRLKMDNKQILPEYLTLLLNSVIVQKQIERDAGGSIINHWRPDQVKATLIPILKEEKQEEIKGLVEKSFNDRKLSKSLLEIAKRGVEMAIEQDEKAAEKWIANELQKLDIEL